MQILKCLLNNDIQESSIVSKKYTINKGFKHFGEETFQDVLHGFQANFWQCSNLKTNIWRYLVKIILLIILFQVVLQVPPFCSLLIHLILLVFDSLLILVLVKRGSSQEWRIVSNQFLNKNLFLVFIEDLLYHLPVLFYIDLSILGFMITAKDFYFKINQIHIS